MITEDTRSITAVVHGIVGNVEDLVQAQIRLAKAELLQSARGAGHAAKYLVAGIALGQIAAAFLLLACVYLLAEQMPPWAAALIVGVVVGIGALILLSGGLRRLNDATPPTANGSSPARRR